MNRKWIPRLTFWNVVFAIIFVTGLYILYVRFSRGLGAATALSDKFPWGLWVGVKLSFVGLAAGAFCVATAVNVFRMERYRPLLRPIVLTGLIFYNLFVFALILDLGRPLRVWHPMFFANHQSVMFEVAICVMLYNTVLLLEFSPILFRRLKWEKPVRMVKSIIVPLVIAGFILSALHQSSLGSMFLIVPGRLHALWYTPLLPFMFFLSAVAVGFSMVIFGSYLSRRAFKRRLDMEILSEVGRIVFVMLSVYFVLKMKDLYNRDALGLLLDGSHESRMFMLEMGVGVVAPLLLLGMRKVRESQRGLFISSLVVIVGFVLNRLNLSITGMLGSSGVNYFPTPMEIGAMMFLVAVGFAAFAAAVKFLPIFPDDKTEEKEEKEAEGAFGYLVPARQIASVADMAGPMPSEAEM